MLQLQPRPERYGQPAQESAGTQASVRRSPWEERWPAFGLTLASIVWIVGWHFDAAISMATTWWRSETFAHGLIVYPVSAWLVWRARARLATLPVAPWYWAFVPLALAGFIALLGYLGGVEAARQFGLVVMIPMAVHAILGAQFARAIAFPLFFTLLAVPFGEFLLPTLMQHTADVTVAALRLSGIPVYQEGLFFTVPSGRWSVVEACSGLRYLIASLTLGLLYAYLTYTAMWRRVLFVVASIVVPIVANWLRAYIIVMIGHLSGMRYAAGVDHLIYGWVFFGIVMLLLFWVGSWWREDHRTKEPPEAVGDQGALNGRASGSMCVAALGVAALAALGPLYAVHLDAMEHTVERTLIAPEPMAGWALAPSRLPPFHPHYLRAKSVFHAAYERDGTQIGTFIAYYARQGEGAELISYDNQLVRSTDRSWLRISERLRQSQSGIAVVESRLRSDRGELAAWQWYWAGSHWSVYPEEVKLRQAWDRLLGRGDDAAVVVIYTDASEHSRQGSSEALQRFHADMLSSIKASLEATRTKRSRQEMAAMAR